VTIERRSRRYSSDRLEKVAQRLMNAAPLCSLATASAGGKPHINHMYFAWGGTFNVFWISDADSIHSRNLVRNHAAAVTVYDSHQTWGKPDRGMQLFGTAGVVTGRAAGEAATAYSARFKDFDPDGSDLPYYRFRPRTVKLFDERSLDPGTLVTARVTSDGLVWLKTEVWA
jgi:general stress protein 26